MKWVALFCAANVGVAIGTTLTLVADALELADGSCRHCALPGACLWLNHHALLVLVPLVSIVLWQWSRP